MEERKTFSNKVKQVYGEHEKAILKVIVIILFIVGYLVSWNFLKKPLSEGQFEQCEQVAREVYEQKGNVIVEAPDDYYVSIDTTKITVGLNNSFYRGKVIARLQDGKLVMTRNMEIGETIFCSILIGILFVLITAYIALIISAIYERKTKK